MGIAVPQFAEFNISLIIGHCGWSPWNPTLPLESLESGVYGNKVAAYRSLLWLWALLVVARDLDAFGRLARWLAGVRWS
jgi:hypothetical protein